MCKSNIGQDDIAMQGLSRALKENHTLTRLEYVSLFVLFTITRDNHLDSLRTSRIGEYEAVVLAEALGVNRGLEILEYVFALDQIYVLMTVQIALYLQPEFIKGRERCKQWRRVALGHNQQVSARIQVKARARARVRE